MKRGLPAKEINPPLGSEVQRGNVEEREGGREAAKGRTAVCVPRGRGEEVGCERPDDRHPCRPSSARRLSRVYACGCIGKGNYTQHT